MICVRFEYGVHIFLASLLVLYIFFKGALL
jgi:hypothetical protein